MCGFSCFGNISMAAKMRVHHFEPQLECKRLHDELLYIFATAPLKHKCWDHWYNNSHVLVLTRACEQAEGLGITKANLTTELAKRCRNRNQLEAFVRKRFQFHAVRKLTALENYNHEYVLRSKLSRWRIAEIPEGTLARRACKRLKQAFDTMPVRVANVLFRTWLNGWCTARRFQMQSSKCLFRCAPGSLAGSHDSIEHYAHCPAVRDFAIHTLNLPRNVVGDLKGFLGLGTCLDPQCLVVQQLLVYAVYTATNRLRHGEAVPNLACMRELLLQYMHQGAAQSPTAQAALDKHLTSKFKRPRLSRGDAAVAAHTSSAASVPRTRFVQGGDHFMTTSFSSSRAPPEEHTQT